jgi:hypothetical protein
MTDYSEHGAVPVEDAAVPDPPTVDEVRDRQAEEFPEQARTAMHHPPATAEELAVLEAGGEPVDDPDELLIEGPNSE